MNLFQSVAALVSACLVAVFYYLMVLSSTSPVRQLSAGHRFRMPDSHFYNSPNDLYVFFKMAGEKGKPLMRRFWLLDFGFIAGLLGIMLIIDLNLTLVGSTAYLLMGVAAVARAAFDVAENVFFLRLLRAYPERNDGAAAVAGIMTAGKSLCLYAWIGILFFNLFKSAFGIA